MRAPCAYCEDRPRIVADACRECAAEFGIRVRGNCDGLDARDTPAGPAPALVPPRAAHAREERPARPVVRPMRPPEERPAPAAPPKPRAPREPPARQFSPLDAHWDRLGLMRDRDLAELAGMTTDAVRQARRRAGIPPFRPDSPPPTVCVWPGCGCTPETRRAGFCRKCRSRVGVLDLTILGAIDRAAELPALWEAHLAANAHARRCVDGLARRGTPGPTLEDLDAEGAA